MCDWLCLDIDGMMMPEDLSATDAPEEVISYVVSSLPDYFHDVSCWFQFSSSQSLPGSENIIKIHLIYLMHEPLPNKLLREWTKSLPPSLHVDPACFLPNQPIFIASPKFIGGDDPLVRRTGIFPGLTDELRMSPHSVRDKKDSSNVTIISQRKVLEKYLVGIMGDGEGREGFNTPLKSAIGAVVNRAGPNLDRESLKRDLRELIDQAPADKDRTGRSKAEYSHDDFLDPLISSICERETVNRDSYRDNYAAVRDDYIYVTALGKFYDVKRSYYLDKTTITAAHAHILKSVGDQMLQDNDFRKVDLITYFPEMPRFCFDVEPETGVKRWCYNAWRPCDIPLEDPDLAKPFFDHVRNLCESDEVTGHFLDWMAWNVQHPGNKIMYALLLQGKQGTGKSALHTAMEACMGAGQVRMVENHEISGSFTGWLKNKSLVVIEEIRDATDKVALYNRLKPVITAPAITINEKNIAAYSLPNRMNLMAFTNYKDAMPMDNDDRRFLVHFSDMKPENDAYYNRLYNCINNHPGAIRNAFLQRDLAHFNPKGRAPATESKQFISQYSGSPLMRWLREALEYKNWPFEHDLISIPDLRDCLPQRLGKATDAALAIALKELGGVNMGAKRFKNKVRNMWSIRNHEEYQAMPGVKVEELYQIPVYDNLSKREAYVPANQEQTKPAF
jgi:hypothetical protein